MTDQKPQLAALFAKVMTTRYQGQVQGQVQKEDFIRAAMEGDPVVYLEAAWSWWRDHEQGRFMPSPGQLRRLAQETWKYERTNYCTLRQALDKPPGGVEAIVARMGRDLFDDARKTIKPSHEEAWHQANLEHRLYIEAKRRMERRGAPPFNPSEAKGLSLPAWSQVAAALGTPAVRTDTGALLEASDLANAKRIGGGA